MRKIYKKAFTINQFRTTEEINSFAPLIDQGIYQGIEIFYPYDLTIDGFKAYTNNIRNLSKKGCEVVMHLPFGPKNDLCDPINYPHTIQRLKDAIDYSKQFNIKKFTLHLGYAHNREQDLKHLKKVLTELCNYCYGTLMIENMPGIKEIGYSPKELFDIINDVKKDNLAFILDIGHANVSEYEILDYIHLLKPYLKHIHLHDNNGIGDEHNKIGAGNIDFKSIIKNLHDYEELYSFEILYRDVHDLLQNSKDFDKIIKDINEVEDEEN